MSYVWSEADKAGKPHLPIALTEYNIWALGSGQQVSHINGLQGVLVTGEAIKAGLGSACRWDLANGYDNGNDHGMFAYNEPGIPNYTPHAPFYHLYFMRRFLGDVLLSSSAVGAQGILVIPSAFQSGQLGAAIINTARLQRTVRFNVANFKFGDRYYTYTLTGTPGEDFSKKVYVNGSGPELTTGGPVDYETIKANSSLIGDEIVIQSPPLSVTFILVESGTKELVVNNEVGIADTIAPEGTVISPNPASNSFTIKNIPARIRKMDIKDISGRQVYVKSSGINTPEDLFTTSLKPGIYILALYGDNMKITSKLVIK
jgi:hypothetical protein